MKEAKRLVSTFLVAALKDFNPVEGDWSATQVKRFNAAKELELKGIEKKIERLSSDVEEVPAQEVVENESGANISVVTENAT